MEYWDLTEDEEFLDYCFGRDEAAVRKWEDWLVDNPHARVEIETIRRVLIESATVVGDEFERRQYNMLQQRIGRSKRIYALKKVRKWVAYAAVVVFAVFVGVWATDHFQFYGSNVSVGMQEIPDIDPGRNMATLILADGRTVALSEVHGGIVTGEGLHYLDGSPLFPGLGTDPVTGEDGLRPEGLNAITTPRGGQYRVDLPDGSRVWLNSASVLRYPNRFVGEQRIVELEGEAYFEVNRQMGNSDQSFLVKTAHQTVEVLGTSFNVSAYLDDDFVSCVLVEGQVSVHPSQGESLTLKPDQKSIWWLKERRMVVKTVPAIESVAWKDGMFYFDETDLREAMRTIGRWYDVEFALDSLPEKKLNGMLPRNVKLNDLISMISETTNLDLTLKNEKTIDVKKRRTFMNY